MAETHCAATLFKNKCDSQLIPRFGDLFFGQNIWQQVNQWSCKLQETFDLHALCRLTVDRSLRIPASVSVLVLVIQGVQKCCRKQKQPMASWIGGGSILPSNPVQSTSWALAFNQETSGIRDSVTRVSWKSLLNLPEVEANSASIARSDQQVRRSDGAYGGRCCVIYQQEFVDNQLVTTKSSGKSKSLGTGGPYHNWPTQLLLRPLCDGSSACHNRVEG